MARRRPTWTLRERQDGERFVFEVVAIRATLFGLHFGVVERDGESGWLVVSAELCTGHFDSHEEAADAARAITPPCSASEAIEFAAEIADSEDIRFFLEAWTLGDFATVREYLDAKETDHG